jgi:hypothetical protein
VPHDCDDNLSFVHGDTAIGGAHPNLPAIFVLTVDANRQDCVKKAALQSVVKGAVGVPDLTYMLECIYTTRLLDRRPAQDPVTPCTQSDVTADAPGTNLPVLTHQRR